MENLHGVEATDGAKQMICEVEDERLRNTDFVDLSVTIDNVL